MQLPNNASEFSNIIYQSSMMARVIHRVRNVAMTSISVLIEGESGTGKELLANAIHRGSLRKLEPFIAVNCGAIAPELIESELFGHVKGAFTGAESSKQGYFQSAHDGTMFLDEIGDLPLSAQVKLLRVLQEKEVTLHRFREDLFYRLAVAILNLPPLRDREGGLGLLIDHCLNEIESGERKNLSVGATMVFEKNTLSTA